MFYRLSWLEHWSSQHPADLPGVTVEYFEQSDGWFEHEWSYQFQAETDSEAKDIAREFVKKNIDDAVWSLYNESPILTEEEW